ncbi:unnamed protein product [Hapterophycus canaliculatus]
MPCPRCEEKDLIPRPRRMLYRFDGVSPFLRCFFVALIGTPAGGGALGHPLDYIQLGSPDGGPRACQYCGIRYQMKAH